MGKKKNGSLLTDAKFPHIIFCKSTDKEIPRNFDQPNPVLTRCPECEKRKGTGDGECDFTVKY